MRSPFCGNLAPNRLYCPQYDMWVVPENKNEMRIGATSYGIYRAGKIIAFTAKPIGASGARGRSLGTVECAKTVLAVHAPLSFILLESNETLQDNPLAINHDPYTHWMFRIRATQWESEQPLLISADDYLKQIQTNEPDATLTFTTLPCSNKN